MEENLAHSSWPQGERKRRLNGCFHHYRFVIALLAGIAYGTKSYLGENMTVAVLRMVNQTHLHLADEEQAHGNLQSSIDEGYGLEDGEFKWNHKIITTIIGCYMFTYTLPQTLTAKLNIAVGCRWAIPIGLTICSVSSLLTPAAAYLGWQWVIACRLLDGLGASGIMPGALALIEHWMRHDEYMLGLTITTLFMYAMKALCPLITGYLAAVHWSLAFYVPSYSTLAFCFAWTFLVHNKPGSSWLISERELAHFKTSTEDSVVTNAGRETALPVVVKSDGIGQVGAEDDSCYKPDSWLQLFQQPALYVYMAIWSLYIICAMTLNFMVPTYLQQFLKVPIAENGFYCSIIQMGYLVATLWPHPFLKLLSRMNLTMTAARNITQALCSFMMAAILLHVGLYHQHQVPLFFILKCFITAEILIIGSIMSNFSTCGLGSVAMAMINSVGCLIGAATTPLVGVWLDYTNSSRWGWQMLFFCLAAAQVAIFSIFWFFIDSKPIKFQNKSTERLATQSKSA